MNFLELVNIVISDLRSFYGQDVYKGIGPGLSGKRTINKFFLGLVDFSSGVVLLNFVLLVAVVLLYRAFRTPSENKKVFQYGVTENNVVAFEKLNSCLDGEIKDDISTNFEPVALKERALAVFSVLSLWGAAKLIKKKRHSDSYVHFQMIIGAAACLLYQKRRLCDHVSLLCVANDHAPIPKALLTLFHMQGKKTCYVQHAPVTKYFPPLTMDLAILYDQASVEAYAASGKEAGVDQNVSIALMPPFYTSFKAPSSAPTPRFVVGVCLSKLPDLEALSELLSSLCDCPHVKSVILRPHPACKLDLSPLLAESKVTLQKSGASLSEFSSALSLALVPTSGVAIELLHDGVPTFYTPGLDDVPYDYYGFVEDGILPVFDVGQFYEEGTDVSFFDAIWEKRFSRYDVTVEKTIQDCRHEVAEAFTKLL